MGLITKLATPSGGRQFGMTAPGARCGWRSFEHKTGNVCPVEGIGPGGAGQGAELQPGAGGKVEVDPDGLQSAISRNGDGI